jgi:hypothetical protein
LATDRTQATEKHVRRFSTLPNWCKWLAIQVWPTWNAVRLRVRGGAGSRRFYCRALAGESNYNICINADLTISCNCQDFSGQGHIGDLRTDSLAEIFSGDTVREFQEALSRGEFPTDVCASCEERLVLPEDEVGGPPRFGRIPERGLMLENTALCNFKCELCREKRPGLVALRSQVTMPADDVEVVARLLHDNGIQSLFYFNLGEPFLSRHILEEIQTIRRYNPDIWIVTSTNAVPFDAEEKFEAALLMDYVYVSLDGVDQESVEQYQVGGNFEKSYENMKRLCKMRSGTDRFRDGTPLPIIEWKYVMFRWNDSPEQVRKAVELAKAAGVDVLEFVPGGAARKDMSVRFYLDHTIQELGRPTPDGMAINFSGVPEELIAP